MIGVVQEKQCTGPCGRTLPATPEFFNRQKGGHAGLTSRCKACKKQWDKNNYNRPGIHEKKLAQKAIYQNQPEIRERQRIAWRFWRRRNLLKDKVRHKVYEAAHPEIYTTYKRNYRSRRRAVSGIHTPQQIQDLIKRQRHKCYYCSKRFQRVKGRYIYHVEHTFPISRVAGTDIPANSIDYLVLACPHCNDSKGDKFPWEWPEGGRLL